jgi:hypothetical protein
MSASRQPLRKALSSLLKNADMPENAEEHDERSDNAIRSQSLWVQQQNTRLRQPVQLISGRVEVAYRLTHVKSRQIRKGGNELLRTCVAVKYRVMGSDWLLVETLGNEPAVVALGRQLRHFVPITVFLRRNPHVAAIRTAIATSLRTSQSLASSTPKNDRVIRTEPVVMCDGRVHGVHVWSGPAGAQPPERPIPGPLKWDMTLGVATDTPESLANSGKNPKVEHTHGRAFAENWPSHDLRPNEGKVLAMAVKSEPGRTLCDTWDGIDWHGNHIRVSFVARNGLELGPDGREHVIARGMNWLADATRPVVPTDRLAQRILHGLAQPGVHRALFDLSNWTLLKWLDEPCRFYDWRRASTSGPRVHPSDQPKMALMAAEFADGATVGVLRMPGHRGGWVPIHVTVNRVELDEKTFAGLVSLRLPTDAELADAGLSDPLSLDE